MTLTFFGKDKRAPAPYELVNGHIYFKASIAGQDVWVLLDNRAQPSIIDEALARATGLKIDPPSGSIRTPTGEFPKRRVRDVSIHIPGQLETQMSLAAIDLQHLSKAAGRNVGAVLGGDLLAQMALMVNSGRRSLQFGPTGSAKASPIFPVIPLEGDEPQVELFVGGKPVRVTLDLGSNGALSLTPAAWARVGPKDATFTSRPTAHGEGQVYMMDVARVPEVKLGSLTRKDVEVSVRPWRDGYGDGIVGTALLEDTDFVLDIRARKLWVVPRLPSTPSK